MNKTTRNNCIETLVFFKDALIYFNFDKSESNYKDSGEKGIDEITHKKWKCPYRDCHDCCMNSKLNELKDNNLIDWVKTIVTFPENLVWLIASCGYDCIFHNQNTDIR